MTTALARRRLRSGAALLAFGLFNAALPTAANGVNFLLGVVGLRYGLHLEVR